MVAFDAKPMRTTRDEHVARHLENSRRVFLALVEKVRTWNVSLEEQLVADGDYETLELKVLEHLMAV